MAYMSQDRKKELSGGIKAVLKKYNVKGSIGVRHNSTLVVNIKSSPIDFDIKNYQQVNQYYIDSNYVGIAKDFLNELYSSMMVGNYDKSDIQSDYFCVGWYTSINIGLWDKPYILTV